MITKEEFLELVEKNVLDNPQIRGEFFKLKRLYKFNLCLFLIGMLGAVIVSSVVSGPLIFVLFFNVLMFYSFFGLFNVFSRVQVIKKSIFFDASACLGLKFLSDEIGDEFIKKTRLFGFQKMKSDMMFQGACWDKSFFVSELSYLKNQRQKVLLFALEYPYTNNQTLIFNCSSIFKPFVAGFEKVDALFSHSWFDENLIFSKNKLETEMLVTYNFVDKIQKIKELFPYLIDISAFNGQLFLAIYVGQSVCEPRRFVPASKRLNFDLIYEDLFGNQYYHDLYDHLSNINKAAEILLK